MGAFEAGLAGPVEAPVKYHPFEDVTLTPCRISGRWTVPGGQFDWGGRLPKSNGGVQRFPQGGWKSPEECIGRRELDCETYKSSRAERRAK